MGYLYFQEYCKIIAADLNKQAARDADSKVIQQINFTSNLDWPGNKTMFYIIEKAKETTILDFSQETVIVS